MKFKISNHIFICFLLVSITSCKKFVDVDLPKTEIVRHDVFSNNALATAAMYDIYAKMFVNGGIGFTSSLHRDAGLAADEFLDFTGSSQFEINTIAPNNPSVQNYWSEFYKYIYSANAIIEGISVSSGITQDIKDQLMGEAKFIRALSHFYLVNLWGDVPLITTTDYRINTTAARQPVDVVYTQIVADLKDAQALVANDYSFSKGERGRPNRAAVTAFLARVYLYLGDWMNAEIEASAVINNPLYSLVSDLNQISLLNNSESIWQIKSTRPSGENVVDATIFVLTDKPTIVALSENIITSFESGDNRRLNWVGEIVADGITYYFPYKYKVRPEGDPPITESLAILRLAEQYLIRAEARTQQGNIDGAQEDLNVIRNRAGVSNTTANDNLSLLEAILQERRVELFAEDTHRWLDLKRTEKIDAVLGAVKAGWQPTDKLFPIPEAELKVNPALTPNPGY